MRQIDFLPLFQTVLLGVQRIPSPCFCAHWIFPLAYEEKSPRALKTGNTDVHTQMSTR